MAFSDRIKIVRYGGEVIRFYKYEDASWLPVLVMRRGPKP